MTTLNRLKSTRLQPRRVLFPRKQGKGRHTHDINRQPQSIHKVYNLQQAHQAHTPDTSSTRISTAGKFAKTQLMAVYAGGYSAFAVDATGHLWVWGPNNYGQCGVESDSPGRSSLAFTFALILCDCSVQLHMQKPAKARTYTKAYTYEPC